jgi:hypothetical protein
MDLYLLRFSGDFRFGLVFLAVIYTKEHDYI